MSKKAVSKKQERAVPQLGSDDFGLGPAQQQQQQPQEKKQAQALGHNPFASALKDKLRKDDRTAQQKAQALIEEARKRLEYIEQAAKEQRAVVDAERFLRQREPVQMTEQEMFEAAIAKLDPIQIERGKFGGRGPKTGHVQVQAPKPKGPEDPYERADALFAAEFGDGPAVKRMEDHTFIPAPPTRAELDKLYRFAQEDHAPKAVESRDARVEALMSGKEHSLRDEQLKLLADARKAARERGLKEISVRLQAREAALQTVEVQLRGCAESGLRILRVITGKGLGSSGEPVLKRALVEWCEGMGVVYAPEFLPDGTFGSFVLRVPKGA
jgi:DNA-nicking Smr family endonuclease